MNRSALKYLLVLPIVTFAMWHCYRYYEQVVAERIADDIVPVQETLLSLTVTMAELRGLALNFQSHQGDQPEMEMTRVSLISSRDAQIDALTDQLTALGLGPSWENWLNDFQTVHPAELESLPGFFVTSSLIEKLSLLSRQVFYEWSVRGQLSERVVISYEIATGEMLELTNNVGEIRGLSSLPGNGLPAEINRNQALLNINRIDMMLTVLERHDVDPTPLRNDLNRLRGLIQDSRNELPLEEAATNAEKLVRFKQGTVLVDQTNQLITDANKLARDVRQLEHRRAQTSFGLLLIATFIVLMIVLLLYRRIIEVEIKEESSRHYLDMAVHATRLGVSIRNLTTGKMYWSDEVRCILGLPDNAPAHPLPEFVYAEDLPEIEAQVEATIKQPIGSILPFVGDARVIRPNGQVVWIRFIFSKSQVAPGQEGIVTVLIDVDEQVRTTEALEGAQQSLARRNEELSNFTRSTAHDLLEPIRMMRAFSELLHTELTEQSQLSDNAAQYLEFLTDGSIRAQETLQNLQQYMTMTDSLQPVMVELNEAVGLAVRDLQLVIQESCAMIQIDPLPKIEGSRLAISSLFQNLIANAIKYRKPGRKPEIHISTRQIDGRHLVTVVDNGMGIEQEALEVVFVPFKRLQSRSEYPGTGLGLSICRRAMEGLGGTIWVESEVGVGSTFYLDFDQALRTA